MGIAVSNSPNVIIVSSAVNLTEEDFHD